MQPVAGAPLAVETEGCFAGVEAVLRSKASEKQKDCNCTSANQQLQFKHVQIQGRVSQTTGYPMCARWQRIWCWRPVTIRSCNKLHAFPEPQTGLDKIEQKGIWTEGKACSTAPFPHLVVWFGGLDVKGYLPHLISKKS